MLAMTGRVYPIAGLGGAGGFDERHHRFVHHPRFGECQNARLHMGLGNGEYSLR